MNIAPAHLEALQALGYTEQESRFLYIVATHSGYFTARQFLAFTGAHWGKRTTTFWSKLHARKHARTECFPKSGTVYHLFSRRLYRQIERENIRNRREHEIEYIQRRIGMLDFVLLNEGYQYLETEPEKVRFFCGTLNIQKHYLPARLPTSMKVRRHSRILSAIWKAISRFSDSFRSSGWSMYPVPIRTSVRPRKSFLPS